MKNRRMRRRTFMSLGVATAGMLAGFTSVSRVEAQDDSPSGKIAFVKDGDIWEWSAENKPRRIVEDGSAMDPAWDPTGSLLIYARDGGSFSDLIMVNPQTGVRKMMTDNESTAQPGSPDYVNDCSWALDPVWSHTSVVCFISDANAEYGRMSLWILMPEDDMIYEAASDGGDQGPLENVSTDANATYCVYTVLSAGGNEGGTTYIALRDLNVGTTYPILEGTAGAYDAAISPDSEWIVTSIRDGNHVSDLWLFNRNAETLTRLTENEQASASVWSPDGEWIAYLALADSRFHLKALRIDPATGERRGDAKKLIDAGAIDAASGLSWAPD